MTTITMSRPRPNILPLLLLACALAIMLASVHAVMTHGQAAMDAAHCFNHGTIMREVYLDPLTGRTMRFCMEGGRWFVSIDAPDGGNVTTFPRSFAKCLTDVIEYTKRSGFTLPLPILP